jgi:hypothetical protein
MVWCTADTFNEMVPASKDPAYLAAASAVRASQPLQGQMCTHFRCDAGGVCQYDGGRPTSSVADAGVSGAALLKPFGPLSVMRACARVVQVAVRQ